MDCCWGHLHQPKFNMREDEDSSLRRVAIWMRKRGLFILPLDCRAHRDIFTIIYIKNVSDVNRPAQTGRKTISTSFSRWARFDIFHVCHIISAFLNSSFYSVLGFMNIVWNLKLMELLVDWRLCINTIEHHKWMDGVWNWGKLENKNELAVVGERSGRGLLNQ